MSSSSVSAIVYRARGAAVAADLGAAVAAGLGAAAGALTGTAELNGRGTVDTAAGRGDEIGRAHV